MKITHKTAKNIDPCKECCYVKGRRCDQCRYGYMSLEERIKKRAGDKEVKQEGKQYEIWCIDR